MKTKLFLKHLWFTLCLPLMLGANNNDREKFYYLPNTIGPFIEGESYSDTLRICSKVKESEVDFRVAIYFENQPDSIEKEGDWEFSSKKSCSHVGEEISFPFSIPKEAVKKQFYLLFTIAYQVDPISRHSSSHLLFIKSMEYYRDESVSLMNESIFEGPQTYQITNSGNSSGERLIAKVNGMGEIMETKKGTIPFATSFIFNLYNENNYKPVSIANFNLDAKLEIIGEEAKEFASFCDEYKSTYLGDVASFKLVTKEIKEGTFRFLLPDSQYVVNRYNGVMRKATNIKKDEIFTRELHLPYQNKRDKIYTMRFITTRRKESFNIPLLSTPFYCYQENNPFGNALNSDYCVTEEIL